MRIIAGTAGGRRLRSLKGRAMRPTQDRVREALFNIIGEAVSGSRFLDLFAGAGGVGIEALSRGAERAVFVENHPPAAAAIRDNLTACGFSSGYRVLKADALRFISGAERRGESFDIVFVDPPYRSDLAERALQKLGASDIMVSGGLAVAEYSSTELMAEKYGRLVLDDTRRFGDTALSFYRCGSENRKEPSPETL